MFLKYVELLHNAVDAMTNLKAADAGVLDYFATVGYEFLVLLIGIAYIVAIVLIISIPCLLCKKAVPHVLKNCAWKRHLRDVESYNAFVKRYQTVVENCSKTGIYDEVLHLLSEIKYTKIEELKTNIATLKQKKIKEYLPVFKNIGEYNGYYANEKPTIEAANTKYADMLFPKTYGNFYEKGYFSDMELFYKFKYVIACIPFLIVYLMFLVPLILLFVK